MCCGWFCSVGCYCWLFGLGFLCLVFCDNVGIMVTLTIWAKRLFIENTLIFIEVNLFVNFWVKCILFVVIIGCLFIGRL